MTLKNISSVNSHIFLLIQEHRTVIEILHIFKVVMRIKFFQDVWTKGPNSC